MFFRISGTKKNRNPDFVKENIFLLERERQEKDMKLL